MQNLIYVLTIVLIFFNGLLESFIGEILSEGIILTISFVYFLVSRNIKIKYVFLFVISLFIILDNLVSTAIQGEILRVLFVFPFVFLMFFSLCANEKYTAQIPKISQILIYSACVSSLFAIMQRFGFENLLPLEGVLRATGFSRSSLNLTGILFAAFSLALFQNYNKINLQNTVILLVIFSGLIAAGGRGGIISALIIFIIYLFFLFKINIYKKLILLACLVFVCLMAGEYFLRAFSAFDFQKNVSNLERMEKYLLFNQYFNFWGSGVGTTSPGAGRFMGYNNIVGFESSLLNIIREIGIIKFILISSCIMFYIFNGDKNKRKFLLIFIACSAPLYIGQQIYQIPSAFVCLIISIDLLVTKKGKQQKWQRKFKTQTIIG